MDFRTFVRTIVAHWQLAGGALLACLLGAAFLTAFQTRSYQSSATVLISFSGAKDLTDMYYATEAAQDRLASYAPIAGGHAVAERAVRQLHVQVSADALVGQTHVSYTPKTTLLNVTVIDTDPARAATLAGAMADQFAAMVPTIGAGAPSTASPPLPIARSGDTDTGQASPATQLEAAEGAPPGQSTVPQPAPHQAPVATASVIERPGISHTPIKPVPTRNLAMGLVAGVLLGIGVALTREAADRTVRNRQRLEQLSGSPTLAELPGRRGSAPRFGAEGSFDDALRGFRTRLLKVLGPDVRRVLLTAPIGGEGTTTTALNLALSFTELGERVVFVEGDVRRPTIAHIMGVRSGIGLANVLSDRDLAVEAVYGTPHENLFVLGSRTARGDESLSCSAELPEVLRDLAARFDRVIVDGPPALATTDTGLLADAVEATVLVVRAGRTTGEEVEDALHTLRSTGTDVVGTVLADARLPRHTQAAVRRRTPYRAKVSGAA